VRLGHDGEQTSRPPAQLSSGRWSILCIRLLCIFEEEEEEKEEEEKAEEGVPGRVRLRSEMPVSRLNATRLELTASACRRDSPARGGWVCFAA